MSNRRNSAALSAASTAFGPICLRTYLVSIVFVVILGLIAAFIITKIDIPKKMLSIISTGIISLASMAASFIITKKSCQKGLLTGATNGISVFITVLLLTFIVSDGSTGIDTLYDFLTIESASSIAGIIGVGAGSRRKLHLS